MSKIHIPGPIKAIGGALAVLLVLTQLVVSSHFFDRASLSVLTPLVGVMIILTIGQALVIGTGGIDLSVAAVVTLVGQIVLRESLGANGHLGGAIINCLVVCIAIGLVNGILIEGLHLNALVVTLAVGELVTGIATSYRGPVAHFSNVPANLASFAVSNIGGISYILIISVGLAILGSFFVHRVIVGRRLILASAVRQSAIFVGLRANGYRILAYVLAACLYGVGGVLAAGQVQAPDLSLGSPYLLATVAAAVLGGAALSGGRVSIIATMLGAAFLTILDYDLQVKGYSAGVETLAQGVALVVALTLAFSVGRWSGAGRWMRWKKSPTTKDLATHGVLTEQGQ
jgi:ribose transport system permease protein